MVKQETKCFSMLGIELEAGVDKLIASIIGIPEAQRNDSVDVIPNISAAYEMLIDGTLPKPQIILLNYDEQEAFPAFLELLRKEDLGFQDVPVIVVTAYSYDIAVRNCEPYGIPRDAIFPTPIDIRAFKEKISSLLIPNVS